MTRVRERTDILGDAIWVGMRPRCWRNRPFAGSSGCRATSRIPLKAYEKHIPASLAKWAELAPERTWLAQRTGAERQWRKLSYGEAKHAVDGLTQGLLNL